MIQERKNIDPKYKWDLSILYADEAAFDADYKEIEERIRAFASYESEMTKSPEQLYAALKDKGYPVIE